MNKIMSSGTSLSKTQLKGMKKTQNDKYNELFKDDRLTDLLYVANIKAK